MERDLWDMILLKDWSSKDKIDYLEDCRRLLNLVIKKEERNMNYGKIRLMQKNAEPRDLFYKN